MRRRSTESSKLANARSRKAKALKAMRHSSRSVAGEKTEFKRLRRERDEALEQLSATSKVLRVISSAPGELAPVFQGMLENAVRICGAKFGILFIAEGMNYRIAAGHNLPSAFVEERQRKPLLSMSGNTALARVAKTKAPVQISDVAKDPAYRSDPQRRSFITLSGARTVVCVPMLKDDELVGAIAIYRQEVRPFTHKQTALVQNFAAQAVIAIENARLLSELRQRTDDLSRRTDDLAKALEQQTATSEVLQVISSSPADLEPVFATMLEKAVRICDATFGNVYRFDGNALHSLAAYNTPPAFAAVRKTWTASPGPNNPLARVIATKAMQHVLDEAASEAYKEGDPARRRRRRARRRPHDTDRADAEGGRTGGLADPCPPTSAPVHRQADRASAELRRAGRYRNREHTVAQ
jgi:hypothetical protein